MTIHREAIQRVLFPLNERLRGRHTARYWAGMEQAQWLPREEIKRIQTSQLQALLSYAFEKAPFYRESFLQAKVDVSDVGDYGNWCKVPLLSKEDVKHNLREMISTDLHSNLYPIRTGGSTGEPLLYLRDRDGLANRGAVRYLTLGWWGLQMGDRQMHLWGRSRSFDPSTTGRLMALLYDFKDYTWNIRKLSAYMLSPDAMDKYLEQLRNFRPRFLYAYTSAMYELARHADSRHIDMTGIGLETIICSAEPLFSFQRRMIEKVFGCRVANEYGCSEAGIIAFECPEGNMHLISQNIYTEFVRDGHAVAPGQPGEVVITLLSNYACPLIRYRLGDQAVPSDALCQCGRGMPLIEKVEGRSHDVLVTTRGDFVHGELFTHIMDYLADDVNRFKIVQRTPGCVEVFLAGTSHLTNDKTQFIRRSVRQIMGQETSIEIRYAEQLPLEPSGKFRWIVSELPPLLRAKQK